MHFRIPYACRRNTSRRSFMKNISSSAFKEAMAKYKPIFDNWYTHIRKYVKIDRDIFLCDFQYILFKALLKFDPTKSVNEDSKFERYFYSSLNKYVKSLKRDSSTNKRKFERSFTPLIHKEYEIIDPTAAQPYEKTDIIDLIKFCYKSKKDRDIVILKLMGNNIDEVCKKIGITVHEYRERVQEIKDNQILKELIGIKE